MEEVGGHKNNIIWMKTIKKCVTILSSQVLVLDKIKGKDRRKETGNTSQEIIKTLLYETIISSNILWEKKIQKKNCQNISVTV